MRAADFVESYFDAWNHRDPVAVADHLAADGVYCDIPENLQSTHDELILNLRDFFATHPHRYELVGDILTGPGTIAFRYRMHPGMSEPVGTSVDGAEFITLHGDAAATIMDYYGVSGTNRPEELARATRRRTTANKYAKSGLGAEQLADYRQRLRQAMVRERLYLRPDLTLPRLAQRVDCSVNHLSQVINAGFGMSFFDFINRYRVEHAKRLQKQAQGRGAILHIAYSTGFNSNSAIYSAFRNFVGKTPAQFRRTHA